MEIYELVRRDSQTKLKICDYAGGPNFSPKQKTKGFFISLVITLSVDLKLL